MKVLHICTRDAGGAGKAALRLHKGLLDQGVVSKMIVSERATSEDAVEFFPSPASSLSKVIASLKRKMRSRDPVQEKDFELFTDEKGKNGLADIRAVKEADILHLHWVAGFVNYETFFQKVKNKSLVWTLHDMNPFTGGCHYDNDCGRYRDACGVCPQLGSKKEDDPSRRIFYVKQKAYQGGSLYVVTPSQWLAGCVRQSRLMGRFNTEVIPNSVPEEVFFKKGQEACRQRLRLPEDKFLLLCSTNVTERKGMRFLKQALHILERKVDPHGLGLVLTGYYDKERLADLKMSLYPLGFIGDERSLADIYNAVDILCVSSLQDNLPNVILEAFACGRPAVGFAAGGIPDLIKPHETGLLAQPGCAQDLASQIEWMMLHEKERRDMGEKADHTAKAEYAMPVQARRYIELYQQCLREN